MTAPLEIIRGRHNLSARHRGCVVTIGNFDGVHLGHQMLVARARELAGTLPVTVLTFEPTPREYFSPDTAPARASTLRGKLAALAAAGADRVLLQRFGQPFCALTPQQFVEDFLLRQLGARAVVVGDDFRFGAARAGDFTLLSDMAKQLGFAAEHLPTLMVDGERCSSSSLREALAQADLERAARLLGRPYSVTGRLRRGLRLGSKLGMPTANIPLHHPPALRMGIYAVRARLQEHMHDGVASLGVRPTLGGTPRLLETHFFSHCGELYGQVMEVQPVAFLRPEEKFDSLDALAAQMQRDKLQAQDVLRRS